jgi:hypothetical protein
MSDQQQSQAQPAEPTAAEIQAAEQEIAASQKPGFFKKAFRILVTVVVLAGIGLAVYFFLSGGKVQVPGMLKKNMGFRRGRYIRVQRSRGSPGRVAVTEVEVIDNKGRKIWLRHGVDGVNATATPSLLSTTEFHTPNLIYDGNTRARLPALTNNAGEDILSVDGKKLRFALTGTSEDAQVQIDMGASRRISKIIVYNNDLEEFKNDILGCEVVFSGSDGEVEFRSDPITEVRNRYEFYVETPTERQPAGITAQFVRLQLKRREILHINEIQVIGPNGEVYTDAVATSSSVHTTTRNIVNEAGERTGTEQDVHTGPHGPQHINNGFLWRTIPGNMTIRNAANQHLSPWTMFQSMSEPGAWVQLDLGSPKPITQVVIYNRNWDRADVIAPAHIQLFNTTPESGGMALFTHDILTNEDRYELDVEPREVAPVTA